MFLSILAGLALFLVCAALVAIAGLIGYGLAALTEKKREARDQAEWCRAQGHIGCTLHS